MAFLEIDQVVKRYGDHTVIDHVSLAAAQGEFVVFVGPSGCGKSTLLRLVAGLDEVSEGRIRIDHADVTEVQPAARGVSMVFQSYALYPHMSVRENMAFGLKMIKTPAAEIERRVREAAGILKLEALLDRRPKQLSGGQRQRVAIGRAIVRQPKLFLFDEPLSNLDAELRSEMRFEIAKLHQALGVTMVYVTHDQVEAMTLADRIVVLRGGKVEQVGAPTELYDRPANTFVAGFIGSPKMNFLQVTVQAAEDGRWRLAHPALGSTGVVVPARSSAVKPGDGLVLGVRPEHLVLGEGPGLSIAASAGYVENLGGSSLLHAQGPDGTPVVALLTGHVSAARGESLRLSAPVERLYLFNRDGLAL